MPARGARIVRLMTIFPKAPLLSPAAMRAVEQARSELFKEVLVAIARSRAKAELAQEARQRVQQNINRAPARRPDEFTLAAERLKAREEFADAVLGRIDAELDLVEAEIRQRERFKRSMLRAREILGGEEFDRMRAIAKARRRAAKR